MTPEIVKTKFYTLKLIPQTTNLQYNQ
jgi:hypothetical protein